RLFLSHFLTGSSPKSAQEWLPSATWSSALRIVLFARQNRRSARGREREGQANEAARMVPVRCHEDSLTLRFRRCQIPVTFTLIRFGNDPLRTFTKKFISALNCPITDYRSVTAILS